MTSAWVVLLSTSHRCCGLTQRASVSMRKCADWVNLKFVYPFALTLLPPIPSPPPPIHHSNNVQASVFAHHCLIKAHPWQLPSNGWHRPCQRSWPNPRRWPLHCRLWSWPGSLSRLWALLQHRWGLRGPGEWAGGPRRLVVEGGVVTADRFLGGVW